MAEKLLGKTFFFQNTVKHSVVETCSKIFSDNFPDIVFHIKGFTHVSIRGVKFPCSTRMTIASKVFYSYFTSGQHILY